MFKELLAAEFAPYGSLSDLQLNQLESHFNLLTRWNSHLNLTRICDLEESVRFHYCESLFLAQFLPPGPLQIADIGSGGGFPGIPVAIFRPDCAVTLVESHQRKSVFLREASRELNNVAVAARRAQDLSGRFDWLISRAAAPAEIHRMDLAKDIALLIGEDDAAKFAGRSHPLPWGTRRALFHVER